MFLCLCSNKYWLNLLSKILAFFIDLITGVAKLFKNMSAKYWVMNSRKPSRIPLFFSTHVTVETILLK